MKIHTSSQAFLYPPNQGLQNKTDDSSEEVSPYSASLKKQNSICNRKGMKSHPDSRAYGLFVIKSLKCWKEATHFHTQGNAESPVHLGKENRENTTFTPGEEQGPKIDLTEQLGPEFSPQGKGRNTERITGSPRAQRPSVRRRPKPQWKNRGYTCSPPQAEGHA